MKKVLLVLVLSIAVFVLQSCNVYHAYQLRDRNSKSKERFIKNSIATTKLVRISNNSLIYYLSKINMDSATHDLNCAIDSVEDISQIPFSSWSQKIKNTKHKPPDRAAFAEGIYLYSDQIIRTDEKHIAVPYQSIIFATQWKFNFLLTFLLFLAMFTFGLLIVFISSLNK